MSANEENFLQNKRYGTHNNTKGQLINFQCSGDSICTIGPTLNAKICTQEVFSALFSKPNLYDWLLSHVLVVASIESPPQPLKVRGS